MGRGVRGFTRHPALPMLVSSSLARVPVAFALLAALPAWAASPELEVTPRQARPGDAVMVTLSGSPQARCPSGELGERTFKFFRAGELCRAVVGLPVEQQPGELSIKVGAQQVSVEILPARFNERSLTVAAKFVEPPPEVRKRMAADTQAFARAYDQPFADKARFSGNFELPVQSRITAPFGDLRVFNGKKQSQHYGLDLDGTIGDPIAAANDGVVVMARDNYGAGRTVLLHHGGDLYTAYFHLSAIEVKHGAKVKRGQRIGRLGKTGRVTGPHLHWAVKAGGLYVNPESVLKLDFDVKRAEGN